jgi:hypothetical protein
MKRPFPEFCDILIQRFEALLLVLQVRACPDEFLHCFDIKKPVNVEVVSLSEIVLVDGSTIKSRKADS